MLYQTQLFGAISVEETKVVTLPQGMPGFEEFKRYTIIAADPESPLFWLQSLDDPGLAFITLNPFVIVEKYRPALSAEDRADLDLEGEGELLYLVIVTLKENYLESTANLRAPLVINAKNLRGRQVILDDPAFSLRHNIWQNLPVAGEESENRRHTIRIAQLSAAQAF